MLPITPWGNERTALQSARSASNTMPYRAPFARRQKPGAPGRSGGRATPVGPNGVRPALPGCRSREGVRREAGAGAAPSRPVRLRGGGSRAALRRANAAPPAGACMPFPTSCDGRPE
ncbi:hypothetical protein GCM10010392_45710 [Streptomyces clavifer]|nr:hypothetical protein GCM10010392_45710 [Streptomyces clavifer]